MTLRACCNLVLLSKKTRSQVLLGFVEREKQIDMFGTNIMRDYSRMSAITRNYTCGVHFLAYRRMTDLDSHDSHSAPMGKTACV